MRIGSVDPNGDAIALLRVRGPYEKTIHVQAVVDTGFNGWLTLTQREIAALQLKFREGVTYSLADGSKAESSVYMAEVEWMGKWRRVMVTELDGGSLLGMAMLRGSYLGIEVIDGGRVEIRPLDA